MSFILSDKEKIEMQQKEINQLLVRIDALESNVTFLKAQLEIEQNKPNEAYKQAKQMMKTLEETEMEYKKLIADLKECKEKYKVQISQVQNLKNKFSKEFKKTRKENRNFKF